MEKLSAPRTSADQACAPQKLGLHPVLCTDVVLGAEEKWQVWGLFYLRVTSFPSLIS